MPDDAREWFAIRAAYNVDDFAVVHGDKPDFTLEAAHGAPFGVEVTDLYPSESHARIITHPDYLSSLWGRGAHMHRDDVETLAVHEATITDKDGLVKAEGVPIVMTNRFTALDRSERLAEALRRKGGQSAGYAAALDHVDLVAVDYFRLTPSPGEDYSVSELLGSGVGALLDGSPFDEVLLATVHADGSTSCRLLRMLQVLERVQFLLKALEEIQPRLDVEPAHAAHLLVACDDLLTWQICRAPDGGPDVALHRRYAVRCTSAGVEIRHQDHPFELERSEGRSVVGFDEADLRAIKLALHATAAANEFRCALWDRQGRFGHHAPPSER